MPRRPALPARLLAAILLVSASTGAGCVDREAEHRVRANAFLRGGDAAAALKECDEGLARKKDDVPLQIPRGKALFELDRLEDARASYAAAVASRENPRSLAEAWLGLAMIASRQRDWASARHDFEKLIEIHDGADAASHLNLARACLELGDMECAVEHAETAQRLHGDEEPVLYTLGAVYLAAGKAHEAELTFQHIAEVIPGAASAPYGLALCAARAGDKAKALALLDEAVKKKLPNPEQIAADPGFASLKDDPEFSRITARAARP